MGHYDSEYEKYYGSLKGKFNYSPHFYGSRLYNKENYFNKKGNYLVKRIIRDLIGVLALFVFMILCKVISNPQTENIYKYSKSIINQNYDYGNLKNQLNNININYIEGKIKDTVNEIRVDGEK